MPRFVAALLVLALPATYLGAQQVVDPQKGRGGPPQEVKGEGGSGPDSSPTSPRPGESSKLSQQLLGGLLALAGGVLGWAAGWLRNWLRLPILKIEYEDGPRSRTRTPIYKDRKKVGEGMFVRLRITNTKGRIGLTPQPAKNCVAYLADVTKWDGREFGPTEYADVLPLAWSHNETTRAMDLPFDVPYWLDVVSTFKHDEAESGVEGFRLETQVRPPRYADGFSAAGVYRLTVQFSADGLDPRLFRLYLKWTRNWEVFEVWDERRWEEQKASVTTSHSARR